jgi:hypothetical protein
MLAVLAFALDAAFGAAVAVYLRGPVGARRTS